MRPETIKILEITGSNVFDIGYTNLFLDMPPEARETKAKINYWDFIKIKSFCAVKDMINKTKGSLWNKRLYFANDISDKGSIPKIYKEFIKLNTSQKNNPIKK